jgi:hypothetical protein
MIFFCLLLRGQAHAHLMVAQHGTLNFATTGAFLVVSLPVSAFTDVDDDQDGLLSSAELRRHHHELVAQGVAGFEVLSNGVKLSLEGVLFNLSDVHHGRGKSDHIVMMGRFNTPPELPEARIRVTLFGRKAVDRVLQISVRRGSQTHELTLTPESPEARLFSVAEASPATRE